jgi:hypothetical protein
MGSDRHEGGHGAAGPGTTKNGEGRLIYFTAALRRILVAQDVERQRLKKAGHIYPHVFFREVAVRRGGEKKPRVLRRTAVRNLDRMGVARSVAMELVGHRTEEIYERYNITSDTDRRDAARKQDAAAALPLQQHTGS